jgi:hypothetical protein
MENGQIGLKKVLKNVHPKSAELNACFEVQNFIVHKRGPML